ncbi:hypothetical protein ACFLU4_03385 [Chloroflexota bacterium]
MAMRCAYHPDRDAMGACVSCGRFVCSECKAELGGKIHCNSCSDKQPSSGFENVKKSVAAAGAPLEELQRAADYLTLRKRLKGGGIGSILFGVIAIVMGFIFMSEDPINVILVFIGIFLLVEGIWLLRSPSPRGLVIDGVALCIIGVWNIVITIANIAAGAGGAAWAAVLGVLQLYWGFKSFGQSRRFATLSTGKPNEQSIAWVEDMAKSIKKANTAQSTNVIEFQMGRKQWKAELIQDMGIFVEAAGDEVIVASRDEVQFTSKGEAAPGKSRKISCRVCNYSLDGKISPELMERYEAWRIA